MDTHTLSDLLALCSTPEAMSSILAWIELDPLGGSRSARSEYLRRFTRKLAHQSAGEYRIANPAPWLMACGVYRVANHLRVTNVTMYESEPPFLDAARAGCRETAIWLQTHVSLGWPKSYIAAEARVSADAVTAALTLLKLDGLPFNKKHRPPSSPSATLEPVTADQYEHIMRRRREGWSPTEIGIELGVVGADVKRVINTRAPAAKVRDGRPAPRVLTAQHQQWKAEAEETLCDISEMAYRWGITYAAARNRMIRLGLDTQAKRDDRHESWTLDLDRCGSVGAAAKHWGVSYPCAFYRARKVGWCGQVR